VDYIDEQIRLFATSIEGLTDEQVKLLERLTALKTILDNINRIVSAVSKIAQKSKLLSFNASVEAARCGTAGKGFAIIAKEMRDLADETTNTLNQIESYTDDVVEATKQVMAISDNSNQSLGEQTARLESVFPRLNNIVDEIANLNTH